jgi:GNAT superfamily N-acetyltransferase
MPASWQAVGTMPFMHADLAKVPQGPDPRVRRAGPDDVEVAVALLAEAYGMDAAVARIAVEPVLTGLTEGASDMRFWLLAQDGVPVSMVLDARAGDVVTLWCMGTPPRFGHRGYGRSLLGHVLDAARQDGVTAGLLGATPAGLPLYEATGWRSVEEWRLFLSATSAQFGWSCPVIRGGPTESICAPIQASDGCACGPASHRRSSTGPRPARRAVAPVPSTRPG